MECDGNGNATDLATWLASNGGAASNDTCSEVTWTNNYIALSDACGATGTASVTFTATDACGNASSTTASFTIVDNSAPTFNQVVPADITVSCDAIPDAPTLTATDACSSATVVFSQSITNDGCAGNYTITRTWTATDVCGNSNPQTQTITVQDITAPTFNQATPADIAVACDALPSAAVLTASDNCGTATVVMTETTTPDSCPSNYTLTRTWTATD